jgi:hypothetical protein
MDDDKPALSPPPKTAASGPLALRQSWLRRWKHTLIGAPRDLRDRSVFHQLALIPVLAWVGLGADALSSAAYGPEEAFKALGDRPHLAVLLALATAATVALISASYNRMIEHFPNGGGYGVASRMLGQRVGVVAGSALIVDYVLTIAISIAAAGEALFSFLPPAWAPVAKLPVEGVLIVGLTVLNLRGVRESIMVLLPMFVLFLITHVVLLVGGVVRHMPEVGETVRRIGDGFSRDLHGADGVAAIGWVGVMAVLGRAYSLGGGTYTGIEAVSTALPLMREPRVQTAQRTMVYLAVSLAICAAGLLLLYLLWQVQHVEGKTLNAVLAEAVAHGLPGERVFVVLTLMAEATLLIVAAQAGFVGGPRVCANMAVDSWLPHSFASLSERLTTGNGVMIFGAASLVALLLSGGHISTLVVLYAINVFLDFSLTMLGMLAFWWQQRRQHPAGLLARRYALFGITFVCCSAILATTVYTKFAAGAWVTILATSGLVGFCFLVRSHDRATTRTAARLYATLKDLPLSDGPPLPTDPSQPTAVLLTGSYGPLGIHSLLGIQRAFPGQFKNVVFVSVAVLDSGELKGNDSVDQVRQRSEAALDQYVRLATALGLPAVRYLAVGTDAVDEAARLCLQVAKEYPRSVFFAGKLIFRNESWYHWLLHNNTAEAVQKRLHWAGRTVVILPARIE